MQALEDLRRIDKLVSRVVRAQLRTMGRFCDIRTLQDEARSAMLERMAVAYAGNVEVTEPELLKAGMKELDAIAWSNGRESRPRAQAYWMDVAGDDGIELGEGLPARTRTLEDPFSERIIERMALTKVFESLKGGSQEVLLTVAVHDGDIPGSATHLCRSEGDTYRVLHRAREEFFSAWFDWERPPKVPNLKRRNRNPSTHCSKGHEFTPENTGTFLSGVNRGRRYCRACSNANAARWKARKKTQAEGMNA